MLKRQSDEEKQAKQLEKEQREREKAERKAAEAKRRTTSWSATASSVNARRSLQVRQVRREPRSNVVTTSSNAKST